MALMRSVEGLVPSHGTTFLCVYINCFVMLVLSVLVEVVQVERFDDGIVISAIVVVREYHALPMAQGRSLRTCSCRHCLARDHR